MTKDIWFQRDRRLQEIKARLIAIREDYAVHILCGGECSPDNPLGTSYVCWKCNQRILPCEVAEKMDPGLCYLEDVEWLLIAIGEKP